MIEAIEQVSKTIQSSQELSAQSFQSIETARDIVSFILAAFQQQLKLNQLIQLVPVFNQQQVATLNEQCVAYFYLEGESKTQTLHILEDLMPKTAPTDSLVTLTIKLQESHKHYTKDSEVLRQSHSQSFQNPQNPNYPKKLALSFSLDNSLNYSLSKTPQMSAQASENIVENSLDIQAKKNTQQQSLQLNKNLLNTSELLPLNIKSDPVDPVLQNELENVKKHLYMMRRYRKIGIQEERSRLDKMVKNKSHLFFNQSKKHTYEYDGSILEFKKSKDANQTSFIQQIKPSLPKKLTQRQSLVSENRLKKGSIVSNSVDYTERSSSMMLNAEACEDNNFKRDLDSQQAPAKVSFSNGNKRQVSHLPFIALKENTKMIQNKKQLSGSVTLRNSLNRSKVSQHLAQTNRFKSFAQIEQEKRLETSRQKALQLTEIQSNEFYQVDILPPTLNLNLNSQPVRKQSKMMQKYLRKLTEQKSRIEKMQTQRALKSSNFQQLKVPNKYPIQRYYEYDYEQDKQHYEFQIASKLSSKVKSINETQYN